MKKYLITNFRDYLTESNELNTLFESNLAPRELLNRSARVPILVRKFIKGEEFTFIGGENHIINKIIFKFSNEEIEILPTDYLDATKLEDLIRSLLERSQTDTKAIVSVSFNNKNGEAVTTRISKLAKTKEFGGGSGSGAGAAQTELQESLAALYFAYVFNVSKNPISSEIVSESELMKAEKFIDVKPSLKDLLDFSEQHPDWKDTSIQSANLLYNDFRSNNNYIVVRSNKDIDSLYTTAKKLIKKDLSLSVKNDKWNPADVWLIKKGFNINFRGSTINELNDYIQQLYINRELVGVSLKKLNNNPRIEIKNNEALSSNYIYNGFTSSKGSKDVYLDTNTEFKFQFRTGMPYTNFTGELIGKSAKQGKIGFTNITGFIHGITRGRTSFPDPIQFKKIADTFKKVRFNSSDSLLSEFSSLEYFTSFSELFLKYTDGTVEEYLEKQFAKYKRDALQKVFSKYIGLLLIESMSQASVRQANEIISSFVGYAKSETNFSSIYLKIY